MPPKITFRNKQILIDQSALVSTAVEETYLTVDMAAASGTLTVAGINGFAINKNILINPWGENAEFVKTHTAIAPTGSTITLVANTVYAHYAGEKVYLVAYNQVELSHATTATGAKTVLTTTLGTGLVALDADNPTLKYAETEFTTGFYFARYKEAIGATFSGYSDVLQYAGWAANTVGYMIDRALRDNEISLSDKVTEFDCYEWINGCLRLVQGKLKRWPEHYSYNAVLGQMSRGTNVLTMPTDAYDTETNKSLIAVRFGDSARMTYVAPVSFENVMEGVKVTQVTTQAVATDITLAINNSYDFADSGSVNFYISGTKHTATYTGVTRSATAGVLTGIPASSTGSITVTVPVDTYIWQDEDEGRPELFTVRNGKIEWYPLADASYDNMNVYGDYSKVATSVDSSGDTVDLQRYDMVQQYLTWRIEQKTKNDNKLDEKSGWYVSYKERLNDAVRTLPSNNVFPMRPTINRMKKNPDTSFLRKANLQDLDINQQ